MTGAWIVCVGSKGTYCVLMVRRDCVIIIHRDMKSATLVPMQPSMDYNPQDTVHFMIGYLDRKIFNVLSCTQYTRSLGVQTILDCTDVMLSTIGDFEVQSCILRNGLSDNWRIAYVGTQNIISVARLPQSRGSRTMTLGTVVCVLHMFIIHQIAQAINSGLKMIVIVKS